MADKIEISKELRSFVGIGKRISQPFYNPADGKIYNCREGSFHWFHEKRHETQDRFKLLKGLSYFRIWSVNAVVFAWFLLLLTDAALNFWVYAFLAGVILMPSLIWELLIEVDAWVFGSLNWLRSKK